MPELPAPLAKKIGPFPVAGWLAIIGFGIALGIVLRRTSLFKHGTTSPGESDPSETDSGAIQPAGAPIGAPPGRVPVSPPSGGTVAPVAGAPLSTNQEWAKRAVELLIAMGIDAITATSAIAKYLDAGTLNYAEGQALNIALTKLGPPPEYVPAPTVEPSTKLPGGRPGPPGDQFIPTDPYASEIVGPNPSGVGQQYIVRVPDGDIAQFVTDYQTIEWVPDSYKVKALAAAGAVSAGTDGAGWPIPLGIPRSSVNAMQKKGGAPIYPADYSGPRTTW